MSGPLPKVRIYTQVIDEFRPVNTPEEKAAWEKRMQTECGHKDYKAKGNMTMLDTCCGGKADDCGEAL